MVADGELHGALHSLVRKRGEPRSGRQERGRCSASLPSWEPVCLPGTTDNLGPKGLLMVGHVEAQAFPSLLIRHYPSNMTMSVIFF